MSGAVGSTPNFTLSGRPSRNLINKSSSLMICAAPRFNNARVSSGDCIDCYNWITGTRKPFQKKVRDYPLPRGFLSPSQTLFGTEPAQETLFPPSYLRRPGPLDWHGWSPPLGRHPSLTYSYSAVRAPDRSSSPPSPADRPAPAKPPGPGNRV